MILSIRKLACAVAAAYVDEEAAAPTRDGRRARLTRGELLLEVGCEEIPRRLAARARATQLQDALRRGLAAREHLDRRGVERLSRRGGSCCVADVPARAGGPRGRGLGSGAEGRRRTRRATWTGAGAGFAKKNAARRRGAARRRERIRPRPGELYLLLREETAGPRRRRGRCRRLLAATSARARVPEAHELGRVARRRQGCVPVRSADPLAGRAARRRGGAVHDPRARDGGAKGAGRRRERRHDARPPLPAAGRGRRAGRRAILRRAGAEAARALRAGRPGRARARASTRGWRGARGAIVDDHGLREEWRDLVEYPTVVVGDDPGGVPRRCRARCSRPSSSTTRSTSRWAADGGARSPLRRRRQRRRQLGGRDRPRHGTRGGGAPARRVVLLRGGPEAPARRARRRPRGRHVPPEARQLPRQGARVWPARRRDGGDLGASAGAEPRLAREAALLAKADLATLMVREFPELQGVMGGIYLAAEGAPDECRDRGAVALPSGRRTSPTPSPPRVSPAGGASHLGRRLARRQLDTFAGYFGLGESPTGSRDPFGLRRAAQGAVRVVLDFWRPRAGEAAAGPRRAPPRRDRGLRRAEAAEGEGRRGRGGLPRRPARVRAGRARHPTGRSGRRRRRALRGPGPARGRAARPHGPRRRAAPGGGPPRRASRRDAGPRGSRRGVQAREEHPRPAGARAVRRSRAVRRPRRGRPPRRRPRPRRGCRARTRRGCAASHRLRAPVGRFFDDVLVMAEDPRVRGNRLALLNQALSLFYRIADISKLGGNS